MREQEGEREREERERARVRESEREIIEREKEREADGCCPLAAADGPSKPLKPHANAMFTCKLVREAPRS